MKYFSFRRLTMFQDIKYPHLIEEREDDNGGWDVLLTFPDRPEVQLRAHKEVLVAESLGFQAIFTGPCR